MEETQGDYDREIALVPIRYDGGDAAQHSIELNVLGESLQGMARILAVTSNFVVTGEYAKQYQAMNVRVLVNEPRANCYTMEAVIQFAQQQQLFSGVAGPAIGALLAWVFSRASGKREEMKMLKDALDKVLAMQSSNQDKLHATLEKMADSLRPAVRQAVAPVGRTCTTMTVAGRYVIDEPTARAIREDAEMEVGPERMWELSISEYDTENGTAKVRLTDDDSKRIKAKITDPAGAAIPNPYAAALASAALIKVSGKALMKDGEIDTLFISNLLS
ncbi:MULTISPECIES: hypothetical protein [unclassified Xanthomonas]|uniref:DUF7946 domain-containing protein n=1 Tax=unclassified Xanthomonas TaxID=2643310 RepID=UPI002A822E04|nr:MULTISPECIES: hypothetical protein [unclassified Xanthomonas]MDY4297505.1 hypothetical protein [Xanthomonas sp. LF02-5]MDY4359299.1 hypothetical protein [Xanthomonas sp. LF04-12]